MNDFRKEAARFEDIDAAAERRLAAEELPDKARCPACGVETTVHGWVLRREPGGARVECSNCGHVIHVKGGGRRSE